MVGADGRIDTNEIIVAEGIGKKLFEDFDSVEFREYCNNADQMSDVVKLSEALGGALEDEHKDLITNYLRDIAEADGEVSKEEELLLQQISTALRGTANTDGS